MTLDEYRALSDLERTELALNHLAIFAATSKGGLVRPEQVGAVDHMADPNVGGDPERPLAGKGR